MKKINLRPIQKNDNPSLAKIILDTLTEFGCNRPGTVFADPQTDFLFEQYQNPRSAYYVAEMNNEIVGGAGIGMINGFDDICELQKMYLLPSARRKGIASLLFDQCVDFAKHNGFKKIYLESLNELKTAVTFYNKNGFKFLEQPLLNTGHFSCDVWMIKEL